MLSPSCRRTLCWKRLESLHKNDTWVLSKLPKGTAIGCKLVFAKKEGSLKEVRYKTKLVAKGNAGKETINYQIYCFMLGGFYLCNVLYDE